MVMYAPANVEIVIIDIHCVVAMEKEKIEKMKVSRKRSSDYKRENLPTPPPDPTITLPSSLSVENVPEASADSSLDSDPFKRLFSYTDRESQFLKLLCDSDTSSSLNKMLHPSAAASVESQAGVSDCTVVGPPPPSLQSPLSIEGSDMAFESPNDFLMLLNRSGPSVAAALSTKGALDQLDRMHDLIKQLLSLQEQNMRMHWQLKNVETLRKLKLIQNSMNKDPEAFLIGTQQQDENSENDLLDNEIEQNLAMLETILAAGNTASNKRSNSKRERSKSVVNEEISSFLYSGGSKDSGRNYPLRRQSAISDFKPKVSKWTKVKAAFKWEKTSALPGNDGKATEAMMIPVNSDIARYLRVPSVPCVGSSGDSVFSSSSGIVVSGGSAPGTPGENSLASSAEDLADMVDESRGGARTLKRDSVKSIDRPRSHDEDSRRSKSLDGDAILDPIRQMDKGKNKSAWSKVKGIVKNHRGSLKSNSSRRNTKSPNSVGCSREASPCDSVEACELQRSDSFSSSQTSPGHRNNTPTFLAIPPGDNNSCPNSPCGSLPATFSSDDGNDGRTECKLGRSGSGDRTASSSGAGKDSSISRNSRKSRHIPEIESVPEGVPVESKSSSISSKTRKSPPKPLSLRQETLDVGDGAAAELSVSSPGFQKDHTKHSPKRKTCADGSGLGGGGEASVPESPSKMYGFFEGEMEDFSSEEVSDQNTLHRKPSPKATCLQRQREEIERGYMELQKKLQREFDAKQQEWERLRPAALLLTNSPINQMLKEEAPSSPKRDQQGPMVEENLSPDFKKKLDEWRIKHQPPPKKESHSNTPKDSPMDQKKKPVTDWQLWKTGQIKLDGQGLAQLPNAKDLPEDFQKKLSEWKQMKAANKVPSGAVQTSQSGGGGEPSTKRQPSKTTGAIAKKTKPTEEHKGEGLSKLKALVTSTDHPKKELVVQTTKGFIKFEGISRKFTRRLFEWEKAKGIGPEASTIALLHPGYAPVIIENRGDVSEAKREKSPGLGRSLSMDSISPNPPSQSISHQPSSLSLNDADELKESNGKDSASNRRVSSNPELELSVEREEPRAVLVEVEDDIQEVVDPLSATAADSKERPTIGQNKNNSDRVSRPSSSSSTILKDSTKLLIKLREQDSVDRDEVRRLKIVLRALIATLPEFVETGSRDSIAFFSYMKDLAMEILRYLYRFDDGSLRDPSEVLENVQIINSHVADLKKSLHSYMKYASGASTRTDEDIPKISITPAVGAQATSSIQRSTDGLRSMATINVTPTFVCNAVKVNKLDTTKTEVRLFPVSSESDPVPLTSQSPDSSTYVEGSFPEDRSCDRESKKIARNLSNGSRKKTRIKRMGSRQNSKTESDSDDSPTNYVLDIPRKTKRKTSRAKKPSDSTEKLPQQQAEDVVYVLKIKPNSKTDQQQRSSAAAPVASVSVTGEILISPTETCVELLEPQAAAVTNTSTTVNCTASVLVKTKRKIFTTVEGESTNGGTANTTSVVVSHELESSSTSDRNDRPEPPKNDQKLVTNLPPLPQSPSTQRRLEQQKSVPIKELSPNIRLMIAKYNERLSSERTGNSPQSSGSGSPVAWRSPVLDRRVRKQTERYQENIGQLSKSASAGSLRKSLKQLELEQKARESDKNDCPVVRVMKSSSTGMIESGRQRGECSNADEGEHSDSPRMTFLAYDSLRRRDTLARMERKDPEESSKTNRTETLKKERLYKKRTESPQGGAGKGAIRKVSREKYTRCRSVPGEDVAAECYDERVARDGANPASPRMTSRKKFTHQHSTRSAPATPVDEEKTIGPMSQRALKLKRAKEEFLRSSSAARVEEQRQHMWNNRISQISTASASSADDMGLMKSASAGIITSASTGDGEDSQQESYYESLPRNVSGGSMVGSTGEEISSRTVSAHSSSSSRFGLSNLASKLRKVKLRRSSKDLSKMNAVSTLCRQSLMVDISGEAMKMGSVQNLGQNSSERGGESLKKSGSVQAICNRFRKSNERNEELKKSRSLGYLEPDSKG
ncbi:uncharacterized protein LOC129762023 isoform X2 [Toxorhynchites rutilus septentrionalis]|uniref:uncharacterized protein LOC129762023 isoform X2 n=1 Tax=Toxorhynchites rutilus septentrionalis TaxID=329112 RepID=UPI00247A0710|nr:uncharacterized protein LOC129762023 isoform X2 [Toxorhynchites rutilus septentrionalis]